MSTVDQLPCSRKQLIFHWVDLVILVCIFCTLSKTAMDSIIQDFRQENLRGLDVLCVVFMLPVTFLFFDVYISFIAKDTISRTKAYIQATKLIQKVKTTDLSVAKDCVIVIDP